MQTALKYFLFIWIAVSSLVNAESILLTLDIPQQQGEVVAHSQEMQYKVYRKFIKKTSNGYVVQEFFNNHQKATSPFLLVNKEQVTHFPQYYYDDGENALLIQGLYERWYINGQQERKGQYNQQGNRTGLWISWHQNGEKRAEGYYIHGKLDGIWKHWKPSGEPTMEIYYKDDVPEITLGNSTEASEGRKVQPQNMPWVEFYKNGSIMSQGSFKDGKREGRWFYLDEQGKKEAIGYYINGKKNGLWTTFWVNKKDQKRTEGNYLEGKRVGTWKMWNEDGSNQSEELYDND